jgi:hydrogenase 3 maturation protease
MADSKIAVELEKLQGSKLVIVGIGNILKSDDGAGPAVCQLLEGKINAEIIDAGTVPENFIQFICRKKPEVVLVIDAVDFGSSPGDLKIIGPEELNSFVISTHTLSPRIFADLLRQTIEVKVIFLGIQPKNLQFGESLSDEVNKAVHNLAGILISVFKK